MNVNDAGYLTFEGDAIAGRMPAKVIVLEGEFTPAVQSMVAHAYRRFCLEAQVSLMAYHNVSRRLADGTAVRFERNGPQDRVFVRTAQEQDTGLQSIFIGVPASFGGHDWAAPNYSKETPFRGRTAAPTAMAATREIVDIDGVREHPGNLTWWSDSIKVNGRPLIVSWYGKATRYGRADYYGRGRQTASNVMQDFLYGKEEADARLHWDDAFKPRIWTNGVWHSIVKLVAGSPVDVPVMSAGLKKETDGIYLWLVSYDGTQLGVYKGKIDPYLQRTVTVEWQFDIDFQVVTTPFSSSHPWWETPLQPLYFNGSCTKCAGLVAVNSLTSVNTSAAAVIAPTSGFKFCAAVVEVDLALATTTFTANHLSDETTMAGSSTGTGVDWHGYTLASPPPTGTSDTFSGSGTNTFSVTEKKQRYGAVDYVGDQLTIAIAEMVLAWSYFDSGSYTYTMSDYLGPMYTRSGSLSRDVTRSVTPGYRVFQYHDSHVLANFTGATVALDTVHMESTSLSDFGTGTSSFVVSADVLLDMTVEGGDLRHKCVVVSELLDTGSSNVVDAFVATPSVGLWNAGSFVSFASASSDLDIEHAYSASTRGRRPARQLVVWKDGTAIETGTSRNVYGVSPTVMTSNNVPLMFYGAAVASFSPFWRVVTDPDFPGDFPFAPPGGIGTTTTAGSDFLLDWQTFATALAGYRFSAPIQGGIPYVNTSAFAPDADASQWFYNIGEYAFDSSDAPATFNPKAGFVIAGVKFDAHCENFYLGDGVSSYTDAVLASPIYLDNVPT